MIPELNVSKSRGEPLPAIGSHPVVRAASGAGRTRARSKSACLQISDTLFTHLRLRPKVFSIGRGIRDPSTQGLGANAERTRELPGDRCGCGVACTDRVESGRGRMKRESRWWRTQPVQGLKPWVTALAGIALWQLAVGRGSVSLIPGPWSVCVGLVELAKQGLLVKYTVASLFRVTWGYLLAVVVAIPFGLFLGWYRRIALVLSPILRILRPISPLAWIPTAILWFGLDDRGPVFLIFLASFFPLTETAMNAVSNIPAVHVNAGRNFGLSQPQLILRVLFPAALPQLIVGLRLSLGIAWLVLVAAEMLAVTSGLGFLIIDARNAGNRYDLVMAGMVTIGAIGLLLDKVVRRLERMRPVSWAFGGTEWGS